MERNDPIGEPLNPEQYQTISTEDLIELADITPEIACMIGVMMNSVRDVYTKRHEPMPMDYYRIACCALAATAIAGPYLDDEVKSQGFIAGNLEKMRLVIADVREFLKKTNDGSSGDKKPWELN